MLSLSILFDYLSGREDARALFARDFLAAEQRQAAVQAALQRRISPLALTVLREQNPDPTPSQQSNLKLLESGRATVVVTGQQLGFLGGPVFTAYKVLSAIALAKRLQAESASPVVPIFWLQSEDHDFAEIRSATFMQRGEQLNTVDLALPSSVLGDCVGALTITADSLAALDQALSDSSADFVLQPDMVELLRKAYSPGVNVAQAFAKLISALFAGHGLLVFDVCDARIKAEHRDFFASAILRHSSVTSLLQETERRIIALGYEARVALRNNSPLLFLSRAGRRGRLIEQKNGGWEFEGELIAKEQLMQLLDAEPQRFTSSALLRPILQDRIFPTAAYVAGPAEFEYWAQIKELYRFFSLEQPLVVPRASFIAVEERYQKLMHKIGATEADLALTAEQFISHRFKNSHLDPDSLFAALQSKVTAAFEQIWPVLGDVDSNLRGPYERTKVSAQGSLTRLRGHYERALLRREGEVAAQFSRIRAALYPGGKPQERVLSMAYFLLKYGTRFLEQVGEKVDPLDCTTKLLSI